MGGDPYQPDQGRQDRRALDGVGPAGHAPAAALHARDGRARALTAARNKKSPATAGLLLVSTRQDQAGKTGLSFCRDQVPLTSERPNAAQCGHRSAPADLDVWRRPKTANPRSVACRSASGGRMDRRRDPAATHRAGPRSEREFALPLRPPAARLCRDRRRRGRYARSSRQGVPGSGCFLRGSRRRR